MNSHNDHEPNTTSGEELPVARRRRRIRVRRSWFNKHYRWVLAGVVALSVTGLGWYSETASKWRAKQTASSGIAMDIPVVPAVFDNDREYFPYSVIPGGVRTPEELREAIKNDPVVAVHYRDFNMDRVRFERLKSPRIMHVSYRIGQNIFWTKRLMHIKAGETVVTDGVNCARGRCGNRMSETLGKSFVPPVPEITEETLDTPAFGAPPTIMSFVPEMPYPTMPILPPPVITAIMPTIVETPLEWAPVPIRLYPPTLTGPGTPIYTIVRPTPPADISVPEPSTFLILASGLGLLLGIRKLLSARAAA